MTHLAHHLYVLFMPANATYSDVCNFTNVTRCSLPPSSHSTWNKTVDLMRRHSPHDHTFAADLVLCHSSASNISRSDCTSQRSNGPTNICFAAFIGTLVWAQGAMLVSHAHCRLRFLLTITYGSSKYVSVSSSSITPLNNIIDTFDLRI